MPKLVTTNLRFPEPSYRELQLQARRRGTTVAVLVREAVEQYLGRNSQGPVLALGDDPADGLVGCFEGSAGDESVNHDHYLYGWPKEDDGEVPRRHERAAGPGVAGRSLPRVRS